MLVKELAPLEIELPRFGLRRGARERPGVAAVRERQPERRRDLSGDVLFDREDVLDVPVVPLVPEAVAVVHAHELHGDAEAIAGAPDASLEDALDAEPGADLAHVRRAVLELKRGGARCDEEVGDAPESVQDLLGDAVAEELLIAGRRHVLEREDRDRRARGRGRAADRDRAGIRIREELDQIDHHVLDPFVPGVRVLREAAPENPVRQRREALNDARRGGERLAQDRVDRRVDAIAAERIFRGEHLVEHHAQRPDVRARVGGLSAELLGGHVGGGAGDQVPVDPRAEEPREAEVEDLDRVPPDEHQVRRLDVAMDEELFMRGGQAAPRLNGDRRRPRRIERARGRSRARASRLRNTPSR